MGGLAGGAVGNAVGGGSGRAAATLIGIFGGAILGDRIEGGGQTQYQTVQNCTSQTFYENRTTSYNVVYEYAGKQYSVQMPNDPGPFVRLQVTPVGATQLTPLAAPAYVQPQYVQPQAAVQDSGDTATIYSNSQVITSQTVVPVSVPVYVAAPVAYTPVLTVPYGAVYPAYYARPYYPPVGVSVNLGWSGGYGGGYGGGYRHGYRHGYSR